MCNEMIIGLTSNTSVQANGMLLTSCMLMGTQVGLWSGENQRWEFGRIQRIGLESGFRSGHAKHFNVWMSDDKGFTREYYTFERG